MEDDPLIASSLARLVRRRTGLRARTVREAEEYLAVLHEEGCSPRAAVLDHDLGPGRADGVELLVALREAVPFACLAFHTATPERDLLEALRRRGVLDPPPCFSKPSGAEPLLRWLSDLRR